MKHAEEVQQLYETFCTEASNICSGIYSMSLQQVSVSY